MSAAVVKYEVVHGPDGFVVHWHCPVCHSTMSSGEWTKESDTALIACANGAIFHLKTHPQKALPTHEVTL